MTESNTPASNKPDLRAYIVEERGQGKKSNWTEIGAGWMHKDGKGFNIALRAVPLGGMITLRAVEDQPAEEAAPPV